MSLTELQEQRGRLVTQAREALNEIKANTDESRSAELEQRHDAIMAEFDKLEKNIEREERLAEIERRHEERMRKRRPIPGDDEGRSEGDEGQKAEYRQVFAKAICGAHPDDFTSEERAILLKGRAEFRAQTAGTAAAGGYTVPTELATQIDRAMKAWGPMYDQDVCTVINTASGNPFKIPTIDDTSKVAGAHTEAAALTDDGSEDAVFGQASLDAFVADTEWIRWSFELDQDSIFNMETLLADLLGERLGRRANAWLTVGTGSGQPNGILTASSLGVTAAATGAITADELINLEHSVNQAYRRSPKARYMFADSTLAAIRKLKDGQGNYLWQIGDIRGGAPATLNNYPFSVNDDMPALGTGNKVVLFGDFGKYYVRRVGSPVIGVVRERFWPDNGIAGLIRLDGEIGQSGAIKHLKNA